MPKLNLSGARCFNCGIDIGPEEEMTTSVVMGSLVVVHQDCPRVENSACNEIDHPNTLKENIMAENNNPAPTTAAEPSEETEVPTPSRAVRIFNKYPRATRVFAVIGGVAVVGGAVKVASNLANNKDHLSAAVDHVELAGSELSASVSTPDTDA